MATYGNYATWNPLISEVNSSRAYADGNRKVTLNNADDGAETTMFVPAGSKGYCEITVDTDAANPTVGIRRSDSQTTLSSTNLSGALEYGYRGANGQKRGGAASAASYGNTFTAGDVIGVAIDTVAGAVWFSKNGTWQASATIAEVNAGTTTNAAFTGLAGFGYTFAVANSASGTTGDSFTGNFGATDFAYTQPTGFIALSTANLPEPSPINYQDEYYILAGIVHTTGTTTDVHLPKTVSGGAMARIKRTDSTGSWYIVDTVRGANKYLLWNTAAAENTSTWSDQNLTGTTLTLPSALSTGTYLVEIFYMGDYFDIAVESGTGSNRSSSHAMGNKVGMGFWNYRTSGNDSVCYHKSTGATGWMDFNDSRAFATLSTPFNNTEPTSTTVYVGSMANTNASGTNNILRYLWADSGPYAFGKYDSNLSADGPFIPLNGSPATFGAKRNDGTWNWVQAYQALGNNENYQYLENNNATAVNSTATVNEVDFLSNGMKMRDAGNNNFNGTAGADHFYYAFGIQPLTDGGINQGRADGTGGAPLAIATGGTITLDGDYAINTFNASGAIIFSKAPVDGVEYLVIAGGGGGGGSYRAGGGGAGGYRTATGLAVEGISYAITVGAGGNGGAQAVGADGANSVFSSITSTGGGGGGTYNGGAGRAGGSGGGGAGAGGAGGGRNATVQGNVGGAGHASHQIGGGGGGAGAAGFAGGSGATDGDGGVGLASSISGSSVLRSGGGGAGSYGTGNDAIGGLGGGGAGGFGLNNDDGTAGSANTGGGGGGSGGNNSNGDGGAGGSGVVIIRYKYK